MVTSSTPRLGPGPIQKVETFNWKIFLIFKFSAEIDVKVSPLASGPLKRFDETNVEVLVRNNTERNVDLVIDLCPGETIYWSGIRKRVLLSSGHNFDRVFTLKL